MEKLTQEQVKQFIEMELDEFYIEKFREKHGISPESSVFHTALSRLVDVKYIKKVGRGCYRKVRYVVPVKVFGRERKPIVTVKFPRDQEEGKEMEFVNDIVFRQGDLILLSGQSNQGKTALCLNFCGENIDSNPILMGNEYTTIDGLPTPRFMSRLDSMKWVEWYSGNGEDKFVLLPVREDYAEHVVKDRINIIDWINLQEHYNISPVMEGIKRELGGGVGIIAIQKAEGATAGRGGQFTKDFADCELLLDQFGDNEVLLTVGKVKEPKGKVMGRKFAYRIEGGVKIMGFREVIKCNRCYGQGKYKSCDNCKNTGYVDKDEWNHDI